MSFQDMPGGGKPSSAGVGVRSQSPSQAVAFGIFQINTAVGAFHRLVDAIGTAKDTPDHRQKLHNTRQRILQLVKDTSAKLKTLSDSDRDTTVNPSKKVEVAKLARDFQTTLQEFQKAQQLASERESTYSPAAPPSLSSSSSTTSASGERSSLTGDQDNQPFLWEQKRQELVLLDNEISFNESVIEEREQGIAEVQEEIRQANEIFKDLAVLVHEQKVVTDEIHSNIDSSYSATIQAGAQLAKASKSTKSKSSWCWWVLVIFVIAVVIFLLILIV